MNMNVRMSLTVMQDQGYSFSISQEANYPHLVEVALFDTSGFNPRFVPCKDWCSLYVGDDYDDDVVRMVDGFDVLDLLGMAKAYVYGVDYDCGEDFDFSLPDCM